MEGWEKREREGGMRRSLIFVFTCMLSVSLTFRAIRAGRCVRLLRGAAFHTLMFMGKILGVSLIRCIEPRQRPHLKLPTASV